jgi:hypothetical protein
MDENPHIDEIKNKDKNQNPKIHKNNNKLHATNLEWTHFPPYFEPKPKLCQINSFPKFGKFG